MTATATSEGEMVHRIAAGKFHTIVQTYLPSRTSPLRLWGLGSNNKGQLGTEYGFGVDTPNAVPILISPTGAFDPATAVGIHAGGEHTIILDNAARVWLFGSNDFGQLGPRQAGDPAWTPGMLTGVTIPSMLGAAITPGHEHTLVRVGGRVWAFGRNQYGQLAVADGSPTSQTPVEMLVAGKQWASACAGAAHTVLLSTDGELYTAGHNRLVSVFFLIFIVML